MIVVGNDVFPSVSFVTPKILCTNQGTWSSLLRQKPVCTVSVFKSIVTACIFFAVSEFPLLDFDSNDQAPSGTFDPYRRVQYGHDFIIIRINLPSVVTFNFIINFHFSAKSGKGSAVSFDPSPSSHAWRTVQMKC